MADPTPFHPAAPFAIGMALAAAWLFLFPALSRLCLAADALIDWISQ